MHLYTFSRHGRWGIVLCLLIPLLTFAQPNPGSNQITIELVSESIQCSSSEITVQFKIKNENLEGYPGRFTSSFHVQSGSSILYGSSSNNATIHSFTIPYSFGNLVTIGAYGIIDNDASYKEHSFLPTSASLPDAPSVSTSASMPLCNGVSAVLTASGSSGNFLWSNGSTGSSIIVNSAGTYYAIAVNSCGNSLASNMIVVTTDQVPVAPVVAPSGNLLLCNGESATLSASGSAITWSNGASGNSITVNTAGSYSCYSSNGCGNSASSNVVVVSTVVCPTPLPGSSFIVCPGSTKTLDAGAGYDTYAWSNGASSRMITVGPGTYTVTVSKEGCFATSAPVTVSYYSVATPTINASGPLVFCQGGSLTLNSSSGSSYQWNTGATGASITVGQSGTYFVSVTDANGCSATSAAVNVVVHPLPTATVSGGGNLCQNSGSSLVVFTGSGGVAPYTFSYRVNGGAVQTIRTSSGNTVSVSVPSNSVGTYTYTLVGVQESSTSACSNAASGEVIVVINGLPTASITGSATVCSGAASPMISFSGSGGTAPYVFTYELNGGALQTIQSTGSTATISVPTTTAGTYVYRLVSVRDASSTACVQVQSGSATVAVNQMPTTPIVTTASTHLCNGASTVLSIQNSATGIAYQWYRNGVLLSSGNNSSITVSSAGAYTVRAVSAAGCTTESSNTITITTGTIPTPVIIGTGKVCPGGKTPLQISSQQGLVFDRWRWIKDSAGGGVLSEDSIFSFQAGQYRVSVEREGCRDSLVFAVTTDDTDFPAGRIELSASQIPYGGLLTLTARVSPAVMFQWNLGNGRGVQTQQASIQEYYYQSGDSIPIQLTAISARNCITHFHSWVKVGDMKNNTLPDQSFAGRLKDWNVFPNPFDQQLKVSVILDRSQSVRLDVFTSDGRWIKYWIKNGRPGENLFVLEGAPELPRRQTYFITSFYNGIKHTDKIYKQ